MEDFDVIVVGAGPAGIAAGLTAVRNGMKTVVIERGEFPGSKNVMGGVLYTQATAKLVPEFWKEAPLERPVTEQRYAFLHGEDSVSAGYRSPRWAEPPYNAHTVLRAKFDRWLAKKAEAEGVLFITETVVEDLLYKNDGAVIGVRTGRAEGDLLGKVVILAEGVNALIAKKAGLHTQLGPEHVAVAVKEIISLPREKIEDRFQLEQGEGATLELLGDATAGMVGTAFIYTNQDSLSLGIGCLLSEVVKFKANPNDLLERLKAQPLVRKLIQGGETKEYLGHLIPEGGYKAIPKMYRQGVLVVGDTAMLVNGLHREGSNLAITSGIVAGEVAAGAIKSTDVSEQAMSLYQSRLKESFVLKDLYKYRNSAYLFEENPHFFKQYPEMLTKVAHEFFTVDSVPKVDKQKLMWNMVTEMRSKGAIAKDLWKIWRALG
ncbi:MAG TPA: FAD-dependent oxidoreductase [Candidatus Deferrimicrobium sp.]|nr:FAD-dependent oxidoreductase [Candidatus Deferrimicrobium sp.]